MIKVGIIGAETAVAGELIRLLVHHPEVEIVTLFAPQFSGHSLSGFHHGLVGEISLKFTDKFNPENLDLVFLTSDSENSRLIISGREKWPDLKIIDMSENRFGNWVNTDMEYGLSEINRKGLVRDAHYSVVPTEIASIVLVSLFPAAKYLLLPADPEIEAILPRDLTDKFDAEKTVFEIDRQLHKIQNSFNGKTKIDVRPGKNERIMRIKAEIKCNLPIDEIMKIYENTYDDHNFTFMSLTPVGDEEVEGTQKCVISFSKKNPEKLIIETVADARMRGGAGDGIHNLNLLFSLYEKTGLTLKSSRYKPDPGRHSGSTSWFA